MGKQILKTLALVLVFAFILSAAAPPKAAAVIPEGLLIAAAIALTMGTCVAITMIAADSAGMTGAIQVAAEQGLQDTAEFTENLIRGFNEQRGMAFTQFLLMMVKGARITRDGALALGEDASAWLTDFLNWAWSEEGGNLQASAPIVGNSEIVFDTASIENPLFDLTGYSVVASHNYRYKPNQYTSDWIGCSSDLGFAVRWSGSWDGWFSNVPFSVFTVNSDGTSATSDSVHNTDYGFSFYECFVGQKTMYYVYDNLPLSTVNTNDDYPTRKKKIAYIIANASHSGEEREEADTNVLQLPAEGAIDTNILNLPDQITLPPVQGTATADSYLDAVRDAIYEGTGTLDYTDANDIAGTATLEMTGTATVDQVASGAGELEGSTEIAEGVGSPTLDNYSIDLRDFFPFCIPFDLYDMLNLMSGSRAAPQVHWEFYVPGPNGMETYNLDLDFSVLDPVASVLRTMELLAFGFALALATKKLLMGS